MYRNVALSLYIICSNILLQMQVIEIGLYEDACSLSLPGLSIGEMNWIFQSNGDFDSFMDCLNILVRGLLITGAINFNRYGDRPSGPVDLFLSNCSS